MGLFFLAGIDVFEVDDFEDYVVDSIVVLELWVVGYFEGLYGVDKVSDQQFVVWVVVDQKKLILYHPLQIITAEYCFLQGLVKLI